MNFYATIYEYIIMLIYLDFKSRSKFSKRGLHVKTTGSDNESNI